MPEYIDPIDPDDTSAQDAFLPPHIQEFMGDTLHVFAGIRPDLGLGGISVQADLILSDDIEIQYARVSLVESLEDVMSALRNRINEWYEEHPDFSNQQ